MQLEGPRAKNASRRIADNACKRVWTFNYMNANERRRTHTHERGRKGMVADIWARTQTYMHERTRMGTDADVHAHTRTDADVLWDLSERTRTHVNERTQALCGRKGEKNMRYAAG